MKLKFLGTAAAEGVPAVFCNCDTCRRAKERGGRDVRTRSQILIDDDTLFDFPMDTYMHMLNFKLDLSAVKRILITHAHMDHCYPQEFCMRGQPFAHGMTESNAEIFCNSTVKEIFLHDTAREIRPEIANSIKVTSLVPFERVYSSDMTIIALPASHTVGEDCLVYYVERGGVGALFLNDTGLIDREVFVKLRDMGGRADIATFDCTYGAAKHGKGRHMGLYDIAELIDIMKSADALKPDAMTIATHLSHNTDLDYVGIAEKAAPYNIEVAYDGMTVEVNKNS